MNAAEMKTSTVTAWWAPEISTRLYEDSALLSRRFPGELEADSFPVISPLVYSGATPVLLFSHEPTAASVATGVWNLAQKLFAVGETADLNEWLEDDFPVTVVRIPKSSLLLGSFDKRRSVTFRSTEGALSRGVILSFL